MPDQLDMIDWLRTHEETKPGYLWMARDAARKLLETHEAITINQVREVCPPPSDLDPRVMGAVFRHRDFEATGEFVLSSRELCHRRPIQRFRLTNYHAVQTALGMAR